jgi:hypothetical protein
VRKHPYGVATQRQGVVAMKTTDKAVQSTSDMRIDKTPVESKLVWSASQVAPSSLCAY